MPDPVAFVATQALLVWFIVISAIVPIPKPNMKTGWGIVAATTIAAIVDVKFFYGEWIVLIAAAAGYGWGTVLYKHSEKVVEKRKARILNGE